MQSRFAMDALKPSVARRSQLAGHVVHSDRGLQFRSRKSVAALVRHVNALAQNRCCGLAETYEYDRRSRPPTLRAEDLHVWKPSRSECHGRLCAAVADDLSANRSEQERVRSELARLQDELVRLEDSKQVLTKVQEMLGGTPKPAAKQRKSSKAAAVPVARGSNRKKAAGKSAAAAGRKAPKKARSPKKAGEPTWLELTTAYLGGQSELRSAAEVAALLTETHPERTVQVTVVRNSLEQGSPRGCWSIPSRGVRSSTAPPPLPQPRPVPDGQSASPFPHREALTDCVCLPLPPPHGRGLQGFSGLSAGRSVR